MSNLRKELKHAGSDCHYERFVMRVTLWRPQMSNKVNRAQRRRLFLSSFIGFTIIYLIRVIVLVLFRRAILTARIRLTSRTSARLAGPPKSNESKTVWAGHPDGGSGSGSTTHPLMTTTVVFNRNGKNFITSWPAMTP